MIPRPLLPFLLALAARKISASCECGYTVNATSSETFARFTEILETDFLHVHDLGLDTNYEWIPQAYNTTPQEARGPFGKAAQLSNVIPNPIPNPYNWGGPGIHGLGPGLQLWVREQLMPISNSGTSSSSTSSGSMVPIAEIVSQRDDILYGSFRIGMRTTAVNGTCGAFFSYYNDSSEIDLEFLSKQQTLTTGSVNLVIQSPQNEALGYVPDTSSDFDLAALSSAPDVGYNEYRFDWLPDRVDFYANSRLLRSMTENIPHFPGHVHVIHWSDGNAGWSAGPPSQDAVLTVSYIKAYFNSSSEETTAQSLSGCRAGRPTCEIPDVKLPPNPLGTKGNATGRTFFFTNTTPSAQTGKGKGGGSKTSDGYRLTESVLAVAFGVGLLIEML